MNGELAQLVALAAHGNAFLSGAAGMPDLEGTSALKWIRSIRFDGKAVQAEYEALSRRLFAAVLEGIVTAANSFDGAAA